MEEENEVKQSVEREKAQALEIRDRVMERYGETKKRALDGQDNVKSEKRRRKSGDTFEWLRENCAMEKNLREEDIKEKKEEKESQREERAACHTCAEQCTTTISNAETTAKPTVYHDATTNGGHNAATTTTTNTNVGKSF